jgi:hypothetical protein
MNRTNIFPVTNRAFTSKMLSDEPIQIDGMKLVFDVKVALYPAKLYVEDTDKQTEKVNNGRSRTKSTRTR